MAIVICDLSVRGLLWLQTRCRRCDPPAENLGVKPSHAALKFHAKTRNLGRFAAFLVGPRNLIRSSNIISRLCHERIEELIMASSSRQPTSYSTTNSNRGPPGPSGLTTTTSRGNTARLRTSGRPKSAASAFTGEKDQTIICAISESRGISPTVGLALVNVTTYEAVLCQICDSQTYVKTIHKLMVYGPTEILFMSTTTNSSSKLFPIVQENVTGSKLTLLDRKYWAENTGLEVLHQLAFKEDLEALKVTLGGNYFATCCFAAVGRSMYPLGPSLKILGHEVYRALTQSHFRISFPAYQI